MTNVEAYQGSLHPDGQYLLHPSQECHTLCLGETSLTTETARTKCVCLTSWPPFVLIASSVRLNTLDAYLFICVARSCGFVYGSDTARN